VPVALFSSSAAGTLFIGSEATNAGNRSGCSCTISNMPSLARRASAGDSFSSARYSMAGIDSVTRVVKVVGFVASAPGFHGQPGVINGASQLLGEVFGDAGKHARSAVGVSELPLDAPVEVEIIVEVV